MLFFKILPLQITSTSDPQKMDSGNGVKFLQWALPKAGYRWPGFRKPRGQVLKRVRDRMKELRLSGDYDMYHQYLEENPEEWVHFDCFCYVTISKFFRDRKVWEYLRDEVLREILLSDISEPVELWSAGCCNGEEPYSLAIIIEELSKNITLRDISILATDRNNEQLKRARKGRYPSGALNELTDEELAKYFSQIDNGEEDYEIENELARNIKFEKRDISESFPHRNFDVVLCRNLVFTYFLQNKQKEFLRKLKPHLKPDGLLIIGSNEILPDTPWLKKINNSHPVYKKCN
ncbi:hypothetical protein BH23BAC3_BH23BAC3_18890 [soil metagenome]